MGFFVRHNDGLIQTGVLMPTLLSGAEYHFLDFLSAELDLKPRFITTDLLSLAAALTVRFGYTQSLLGQFSADNEREYGVMRFHVPAGFKFGFIDRKPKSDTRQTNRGSAYPSSGPASP